MKSSFPTAGWRRLKETTKMFFLFFVIYVLVTVALPEPFNWIMVAIPFVLALLLYALRKGDY